MEKVLSAPASPWQRAYVERLIGSIRRECLEHMVILGDHTPDTGCGLKLFPRSLFLNLPYFDHMHRFLPALALREGGTVRSVPVNHRPRHKGASKYGVFDRLGVGIIDLLGVMWLKRRTAHPGRLDAAVREADATASAISSARVASTLR